MLIGGLLSVVVRHSRQEAPCELHTQPLDTPSPLLPGALFAYSLVCVLTR